jgi:alkylation response protein AidB-like acyl-CoA dehydrogenase
MHFDLTEDQREIKRTARNVLARRASPARVRAVTESGEADAELRDEVAQLGWVGMTIAHEHEGLGLGSVEAALILEELGYALGGAPVLATTTAAFVLASAGSDAQRAEWLPRIAEGSVVAALGLTERGVSAAALGKKGGAADVAALVPNGAEADLLILAGADGTARLLPAADAVAEPRATIDRTRTYARVSGEGEPLPGDARPGLDRAAVAVAAELVGVCQRALDDTVAYVKERRQFDRPIGSFQAVAHRCTDMLLATESARSAVYFGAWSADSDPERLPYAAALAKSVASSAALETTASAIQAHGGIGFTWEADVHWLYKRAQVDAKLLGAAAAHRAELVRLLAAEAAR